MRKNKRKIGASILAILLIAGMVLSLVLMTVRAEEEQPALEAVNIAAENSADKSVYIDNLKVSGKSYADVERALNEHIERLREESITLYAGEKTVQTTAGELGLDYANKNVIEEALSIGEKGNVLKRFLADRTLSQNGPIVLDLQFTVDSGLVEKVIRTQKSSLNCSPSPNGLVLNDDGTFSLIAAEDGVQINEASAVNRVVQYMEEEWHGGEGGVDLEATLLPATDTSDQLRQVRNILGEAATVFDADNAGRATNITIATGNIDGTVLYPGEEFSAIEAIGPTEAEYGFALGASYAGDDIVETYGGGVCQVTSTLYDAVLEAELEVTERHNHTMRIHYVDPAFDATMSDDNVDFRFINSTDSPIYIEGNVEYDTVTFRIYGQETRDPARSIVYESRILTTSDYETVYKVDEKADFGVVQEISGEEGMQAELWKIISINGEYDSEEKVNSSTYSPINHAYRVGIVGASDATVSAIYNAVGARDLDAIYSAVGNGTTAESVTWEED